MALKKEFEWRSKALLQLYEAASYIEQELGSPQAAQNLVRQAYKIIDKICEQPMRGMQSEKRKTIRSILIDDGHRRLYYTIRGKKVIGVFIFDTRQNPSKNPY